MDLNLNLNNKINYIQNGEIIHINDILILFDTILNKYSRLLNGEDTKQGLIIFLINLLKKMPISSFNNEKQLLYYISKSIKYEYIRLSKINSKKLLNEVYIDKDTDFSYESDFSNIENSDLFNILTLKEKNIIILIFIEKLSISEISKLMNTSRQTVNQNKNRALKKLEKHIH